MFDDSDYVVEQYIKPTKVRVPLINDERADLLGNFDDADDKQKKKGKKRKEVITVFEENPFADEENSEAEGASENEEQNETVSDEEDVDANEDREDHEDHGEDSSEEEAMSDNQDEIEMPEVSSYEKEQPKAKKKKIKATESETIKSKTTKKSDKKLDLSDEQIKSLVRGSSKQDRFVLYVTNINYSTTREGLTEFFGMAGAVKSVRVPKVRRSAFAFVEMCDINGFKNALALHNRTLDNYTIKVQISEAGKKKSANKKNILKQKNRKLAEMRNETKQFQRSGKGYDKTIKKEIKQRKIQQDRRLAKKQAKK